VTTSRSCCAASSPRSDGPRPRRAGAPIQGPPTTPKTFTRNNNLGSNHAKAGKQPRNGNHPAQLRSLISPTRSNHATAGKLVNRRSQHAQLRSCSKEAPTVLSPPLS